MSGAEGPVLLDGDEPLEALHQQLLIHFRDDEALAGGVQALEVLAGTEELDFAVGGAVGLHALKDLLRVVQAGAGRVHRDGAVGDDARVVPALSVVVVHQEHVVGKDMAEAEVVLVGLLLRMIGQRDLDLHHR